MKRIFLLPLSVGVIIASLLGMKQSASGEEPVGNGKNPMMGGKEPLLVFEKNIQVRLALADGKPGPLQTVSTVVKTPEQWLQQLGKERYKVLRNQGTEPPFCGNLTENHLSGIYFCAGCDLPLFTSLSKFNSGTGWPSFFEPFAKENISERSDRSFGTLRTEILCARCGGHLGHVFPDGPPPTGLRYCLNSQALVFRKNPY